MSDLTLYVVASPNGIGKTTSTYDLIPAGKLSPTGAILLHSLNRHTLSYR